MTLNSYFYVMPGMKKYNAVTEKKVEHSEGL
jgi:hypothetical protein